jgi:hypothetical protein
MQLHSIDPHLGRVFFPINKAMAMAIEMVLQNYAYREGTEVMA